MAELSLYESDVVTWAERQVAELRRLAARAPTNSVDWDNVIEEIESVGRSEWRSVESLLENALEHVLKSVCDPDSLSRIAWKIETEGFLDQARRHYRPSMGRNLDADEMWRHAFRRAAITLSAYEISIPPGIPAKCPFTLDGMIDESFTHEQAARRLLDAMTTGRTSRPTNQETER